MNFFRSNKTISILFEQESNMPFFSLIEMIKNKLSQYYYLELSLDQMVMNKKSIELFYHIVIYIKYIKRVDFSRETLANTGRRYGHYSIYLNQPKILLFITQTGILI